MKATMIHHCTHIRITRKWLPELGLEGRVNYRVSAWRNLAFNGTVLFLDCGAGYIIMYLSKLNCTIKREFYVNLEYLKKHRGREGSFFAQMHAVSESRSSICHHGWARVKINMCGQERRKSEKSYPNLKPTHLWILFHKIMIIFFLSKLFWIGFSVICGRKYPVQKVSMTLFKKLLHPY